MRTEDILEEANLLSPITLSQLDNLVRFTILPLFTEDLNLTKRECKQASIYIQNKTIELLYHNIRQ